MNPFGKKPFGTKDDAIIGVAVAMFENEFYQNCPAIDREEARRWFTAGFVRRDQMGNDDLMAKIDKIYAILKSSEQLGSTKVKELDSGETKILPGKFREI
jgi:hypothetical protein